MNSISQLYGNVDNLSGFVHPEYGRTDFMSDERLIATADSMVQRIIGSDYRNIVVSETGAKPLAYVCERLLQQESVDVDWTYMKVPRDARRDISPLILHYLTEEERNETLSQQKKGREDFLKILGKAMPPSELKSGGRDLFFLLSEVGKEDQSRWQRRVAETLEGTEIARTLGTPFLFFDEYVDSGTTLQNYHQHFNCFTSDLDFRTISYYMNIFDSENFDKVFFTTHDKSSKREFFEAGAYPFENRLDLIGYFYYSDDSIYAKVTLEGIKETFEGQPSTDPEELLTRIDAIIDQQDLVTSFRENFSVADVRRHIGRDHIVRQYLLTLEQETQGNGIHSEFLWQLADMYGPIWTPMPKRNHFDFFSGTEENRVMLQNSAGFDNLKDLYRETRTAIFVQAADACLGRKDAWLSNIDNLLGGTTNGN